jgi:hypothetical protein
MCSHDHCCSGKEISIKYYAVLYCHLWPIWLNHIFPLYVLNGTIFRQELLNIKCVFWFFLQFLSETFHILKIIHWAIVRVYRSSCKVPVMLLFLSDHIEAWIFSTDFEKILKYKMLWKIHPLGAKFSMQTWQS